MNTRKILLWGIPILLVGLVIACVILGLVRQKAWTTYTSKNSRLPGGAIQVIAFDTQDRAWIGTSNGLSILDGETWTTYTPDNLGLAGSSVTAIAFDEQGHAWIGASFGVSVFDGETWTTYTPGNSGLAGSSIKVIAFDEQGRAWIGTPSGVSIFDGETWTTVSPGEVQPPVEEVQPPVEEVRPPVEEVQPPVEEVRPPVELSKYWVYFFCFSPVVFVVLIIIWLVALSPDWLKEVKEQVHAGLRVLSRRLDQAVTVEAFTPEEIPTERAIALWAVACLVVLLPVGLAVLQAIWSK